MDFNINKETGNGLLQTINQSEGGRAFKLLQEREKMQEKLEEAKKMIETSNQRRRHHKMDFGGSEADKLEQLFREETIGLVSFKEFKEKRMKLNQMIDNNRFKDLKKMAVTVKKKGEKLHTSKLSFVDENDEEEDDDENSSEIVQNDNNNISSTNINNNENGISLSKPKYLGKDPTVDTQFLPDLERDIRLQTQTEMLIKEYYDTQEAAQKEKFEVTYSYWDGVGHRRSITIPKGTSIGEFLDICRKDLENDFHELRTVASDNLMYIKEDLILPHTTTFYELIKTKARGKSGPLFHFDVHDDIRLLSNARIEKDESHAGKIVDKKWYERNKHIFPASRWEMYNANKTFNTYTIHGDKDHSKMPIFW